MKDDLDGQDDRRKESAVEFSVELKDRIQDTRVTDLERYIVGRNKEFTEVINEESLLLKENLREREEQCRKNYKDVTGSMSETVKYSKQEPEEESITHVQMKIPFEDGWEKVQSQNVEVKKVDNLHKVNETDLREKNLTDLTSSVEKGLQVK